MASVIAGKVMARKYSSAVELWSTSEIAGSKGTEQARYPMGHRMREIVEAADGSLYALEDGAGGRLLHLTPSS